METRWDAKGQGSGPRARREVGPGPSAFAICKRMDRQERACKLHGTYAYPICTIVNYTARAACRVRAPWQLAGQPRKKMPGTDIWETRVESWASTLANPRRALDFVHYDPMALNPSRSAFSATCKALRRCSSPAQSVAQRLGQPVQQLSTSASRSSEEALETAGEQQERPRWSYTPERMKGPGFSINVVKNPSRTVWHNNDDPAKLDAMYTRLLGSKGDRMLPDEIKWLAITHKSFDQGRRGFNTRLAYFGGF